MKKLFLLSAIFFVLSASAKRIVLPHSTGIYITNVAKALNPQPGDTLLVPDVPSLINMNLQNFSGTAEKPIVITWANPKTKVGGYNAYGVVFTNVSYVILTNFFIDCTRPDGNRANGYALAFGNGCHNIQVYDGIIQNSGAGMVVKWQPTNDSNAHPVTINNITVKRVTARNINAEGFYFGHTRTGITNGLMPAMIKKLVVENVTAENCGWDGIQFSSIDGLYARNLRIVNSALLKKSSQNSALAIQAWVNGCDIDGVYIENTQGGVTILAKGEIKLKNVQVRNCALAAFYINDYPAEKMKPLQLVLENIDIDGAGTYAFWAVNRNKSMKPGVIKNFTYKNAAKGIADASKSKFISKKLS